jgi:sterol desaturase/sphingolipid hydroxylase (fatty acid hydroxylase superfamily)
MDVLLLGSALLGALTWSLLEYVIHRWLGHDKRFRPNPFGTEHVRHHAEGDYFAPTWKKGLLVGCVGSAVSVVASHFLGAAGVAYVVGLFGFYVAYEVLHRLEHVWAGIGPYGRWTRRHHFYHHFVDARFNHGVTSPLWDFVFRTYRKPSTIAVPPRLAMKWLLDPATGGIRVEHAPTFTLGKSPSVRGTQPVA